MATILHRLASWAEEQPKVVAQRYQHKGAWKQITTREFCNRVYWLALFLESKGMGSDDVGTILAYNSPAWVHLDLAFCLLGAKSAGIYPNSSSKDIQYVLGHTESQFFCVGDRQYFEKVSMPGATPEALANSAVGPMDSSSSTSVPERIKLVIAMDNDTTISSLAVSYKQAVDEGKKLAKAPGAKSLKDYLDRLDPQAGAFIIYTSGTTGNPKGAVISHDNLVYTIDTASKYWKLPVEGGSLFSFLPLCHIAEKVQNIGGGILLRYTVSFCTSFDNVSKELPTVQPSLILCVPRLWEKMMEAVEGKRALASPGKQKLITWAFGVGTRVSEGKFTGRVSLVDQLQWPLADRLVLSKIREALGLGKAQVLVSGAAPLSPHVCRWFRNLGLDLMEVFGQTESTGIICLTIPGQDCAGTVGKPVPGFETQIASDGEIVTKGRHVFKGYFKDRAATQATVEDGWLKTGDLAEWTQSGLLRIRGRKKEILKTSGGKMVAPSPIEESLKQAGMISQVCMVGDGRKYLSALVTLTEARLQEIHKMNGAQKGLTLAAPELMKEVMGHVDRVNEHLAGYEQIKKVAIMAKEFSIAEGEMTPTLKMKRNVIESRYRDVIEGLYGQERTV